MEKRVLKIKLKSSGTRRSINGSPDRGSSGILLEGTVADDLNSSSQDNIHLENFKDMKRKRGPRKGHKKGKRNDSPVVNDPASAPVCVNTEDSICLDQTDDSRLNSEMDIEPPSIGSDKPSNISNIKVDQPTDTSAGKARHGRLRVKLKSSRVLEPHRSCSDVQTPSDTDKSNQQAALELNDTAVEKEDSTFSDGQTSEIKNTMSENLPRKAGSIKIKSSRGLGFSCETMRGKNLNELNRPPQMLAERNLVLSDNEKTADSLVPRNLQQKEMKRPYRDSRYNEKELSAALAVVKKVMKMEAAGPFNAPVNPVALGIPDYFDIIDTPMDFGTICHDLEHGHKYMNSEDVFKDVQFIWENCYKYNNKGDYIVDLMKRVKKNFLKYWTAAGLYLDNGVTDSTQIEDGIRPSQDQLYPKGKPKHKRRRYGIDRHKSDCLCAVCVVRRRRKEREENSAVIESQMRISNANLPQEFKLEESSPLDNPCSEDATTSLDHSQETDANADTEEVENEEKMETPAQTGTAQPEKQGVMNDEMELCLNASGSSEPSLQQPLDNGAQEDSNQHSQEQEMDLGTEPGDQKVETEVQQQDQDEEKKHGESADERSQQQIMVQENPLQQENHSILHICRSLFPSDVRSLWNGPHSLKRRHVSSIRDSPIHSAVAAFMKQ